MYHQYHHRLQQHRHHQPNIWTIENLQVACVHNLLRKMLPASGRLAKALVTVAAAAANIQHIWAQLVTSCRPSGT